MFLPLMFDPLSSGSTGGLLRAFSILSMPAWSFWLVASCCFMNISSVRQIPSTSTAQAKGLGSPCSSPFSIFDALWNRFRFANPPQSVPLGYSTHETRNWLGDFTQRQTLQPLPTASPSNRHRNNNPDSASEFHTGTAAPQPQLD